jgi:hypothetical protein
MHGGPNLTGRFVRIQRRDTRVLKRKRKRTVIVEGEAAEEGESGNVAVDTCVLTSTRESWDTFCS